MRFLVVIRQMFQRALHGHAEALGSRHTSTVQTVKNLENVYKEAEQMFQRVLAGL
jgi:hypothetical protein